MNNVLLYTRLGVYPSSNKEEIKKAYNKLSKIYHPDKNLNNINYSQKKFTELVEAKDILLDSDKRKDYDLNGLNGLDDITYSFTKFDPLNDIINFDIPNNKKLNFINKNIIKILHVTLEDLYNEKIININYNQKIYCIPCDSTGVSNKIVDKCSICNNKHFYIKIIKLGNVLHKNMERCNICINNNNNNNNDLCSICSGKGFTVCNTSLDITLKSGLSNDNKIILNNKGNKYKHKNSNLIVILKELQHSIYSRINNDLYIDIELKLYQALFGFEKILIKLNEQKIYIKCITQTSFNDIRKIDNEGMQSLFSNSRGHLYIKFNIILPNILNILSENKIFNLKKILYNIDSKEFENEKNIKIKNNTLLQSVMIDCNKNYI